MGFKDNIKRSLGFEETEFSGENTNEGPSITERFNDIKDNIMTEVSNFQNSRRDYQSSQPEQDYDSNINYRSSPRPNSNPNPSPNQAPNYNPNPEPMRNSVPIYDAFDDYVITPEQSFYEIALIRPKSIDDVNYIVDQVIEEKNPVIVDLSFLERESHANFRLAGEKIKKMRTRYGAQALLLARSENKNLIIISPKQVKLVNKN